MAGEQDNKKHDRIGDHKGMVEALAYTSFVSCGWVCRQSRTGKNVDEAAVHEADAHVRHVAGGAQEPEVGNVPGDGEPVVEVQAEELGGEEPDDVEEDFHDDLMSFLDRFFRNKR